MNDVDIVLNFQGIALVDLFENYTFEKIQFQIHNIFLATTYLCNAFGKRMLTNKNKPFGHHIVNIVKIANAAFSMGFEK